MSPTESPEFKPFLEDAGHRARFYPYGLVAESDLDYNNFLGKARVSTNLVDWFDYSPSTTSLCDGILHEVCHYLQYCSTSFGVLCLPITLAIAEAVLCSRKNLWVFGSHRTPSSCFGFLHPPSNPLNENECKAAIAALSSVFFSRRTSARLAEQVMHLERAVTAVVSPHSQEGAVLTTLLSTLKRSAQEMPDVELLYSFCEISELPLFGADSADVASHCDNGRNVWRLGVRDLIEGHARLLEEYTLLTTCHRYKTSCPWLADLQYRMSKQTGTYAVTRHLVSFALRNQPVIRALRSASSNGRQLDLNDVEVAKLYSSFLAIQVLVHEVALMVPFAPRCWDDFYPVERFFTLLQVLMRYPDIPSGFVVGHWDGMGDSLMRVYSATVGQSSESYSASRAALAAFVGGELSKVLPALSAADHYRGDGCSVGGIPALLVNACVGDRPGPFLIDQRGTIASGWCHSDECIPQWQTWMWGVLGTAVSEEQMRDMIHKICWRTGGSASPFAKAATRTGLIIDLH